MNLGNNLTEVLTSQTRANLTFLEKNMFKLTTLNSKNLIFLGGISLMSALFSSLVLSQVDRNFGSVHLLLVLGNPSGATQDASNVDNLLLIKRQYALSYNKSKSSANWVSWQLNKNWLGPLPRCRNASGQDNFQPDNTLPAGFKPVLPTDYAGSGFDRGHITPSGDRTARKIDNCATFLMTNIIPQSPDINQGPWNTLEEYGRKLVKQDDKELYIISGGVGTGGTGKNGFKSSFQGKSSRLNITVPESTWKIIVILDRPGLGLGDINKDTRVIAVLMPQKQGSKADQWDIKIGSKPKYITSVREIEKLTGYNFLSNVPQSAQDVIETKVDQGS